MVEIIENSIYVGCALTHAPAEFRDEVFAFRDLLRPHHQVLDFAGLGRGDEVNIYDYDTNLVDVCTLFVPIYTHSSTGLGIETQKAVDRGKPILGLAHEDALVAKIVLDLFKKNLPQTSFHRVNYLSEAVELVCKAMDKVLKSS